MNHNKTSIQLTAHRKDAPQKRIWLLLPAVPIYLGLWGMFLPLGWWLWPGSCTVVLATLLCWQKRWQRVTLTALCAAGAAICIAASTALTQGLAALANMLRQQLTQKTGYYVLPLEPAAWRADITCFAAVLAAGLTAVAVRALRGTLHFLSALGVLALVFSGLIDADVWLALYLGGTLLLAVFLTSGEGRSMVAAMLVIAAVMGCLATVDVKPTAASLWLQQLLHRVRYESVKNPLPEGNLQNLGAFSAGEDTALELRMEDWSATYLRGYVGSVYTEQGWLKTDLNAVTDKAQTLYALQRDYFFPATQRGAAEEERSENDFTVKTENACRAECYIPYGAAELDLDRQALRSEGCTGQQSLHGTVYDVSESYLTQEKLAQEGSDYRIAEAAYRTWVYDQYLQVPDAVRQLLGTRFAFPEETVSNTQARQWVTQCVQNALTYDEAAVMEQGDMPFLEYLLTVNPRGYSVQYATLATLLMRCCGIPARYVEGYLLTGEQAEQLQPGQWTTLRQSDSHAWTEIYLDGVGWIPFDTTPQHKDEITYRLPPNGQGTSDTAEVTPQPLPSPGRQEIQIQRQPQEPEETVQSLQWLWLLLLAGILALLVRTILLRRRLTRRIRRFSTADARSAGLDCLAYTLELLGALGFPVRNVPLGKRTEEITAILNWPDPTQVEAVVSLAGRLAFSKHPATEEDRALALAALTAVGTVWRTKTPWTRRMYLRWFACKVK